MGTEITRSYLRMRDGRAFPLSVDVEEGERLLAAARAAGEEFLHMPAADPGFTIIQFLAEADGIADPQDYMGVQQPWLPRR